MASFSQQMSLTVCLVVVVLAALVSSDLICEDKTKSCGKWIGKKLCDETSKYKKQRFFVSMSRLCKRSCLMCGEDDASLFDTDSRCNSYLKKGYCDMKPHQGFMLRRCKYSCRNTIRSGIMSPGRGNFQRKDPAAPRQGQQLHAANWNQPQADGRYPQQYGQQYAQQYAQQYGLQYQPQQAQGYGQQQQGQQQTQNNGQQQYAQQNAQQNDAQTQQQTAGQQPQQTADQPQPTADQQPPTADQQQQAPEAQQLDAKSLSELPVTVQALSNPSRKHKLEKNKHHDNDMDDSDDDSDDDMD